MLTPIFLKNLYIWLLRYIVPSILILYSSSIFGIYHQRFGMALNTAPAPNSQAPLLLYTAKVQQLTRMDSHQLEVVVQANENNSGPVSGTVSMVLEQPILGISPDSPTSCLVKNLSPGAMASCHFQLTPRSNKPITYWLRVLLDGGQTYRVPEKISIHIFPLPAETILKNLAILLVPILGLQELSKRLGSSLADVVMGWFLGNKTSNEKTAGREE